MHPSLFFPFFPNNNDNFEDFIKSYNYWSGSIVLTSDKSSGSIINKNPQHLWDYNLNDFDHSNLLHGLENLVRANYLAGAEEIMVAASPTMQAMREVECTSTTSPEFQKATSFLVVICPASYMWQWLVAPFTTIYDLFLGTRDSAHLWPRMHLPL